jgi:TM2 domain-containing membrane protein YozV
MNTASTTVPSAIVPATPAIPKAAWIAYILFLFLGLLGAHKFYLGKTGWGILYIFTGGIFAVGLLIDLFSLPAQVRHYNQGLTKGGCWA